MAKVDITTAGHTIVVEADAGLNEVAAKALELWQATRDPKLDRACGASGFHAERADGLFVEPDADLGHPAISLRSEP